MVAMTGILSGIDGHFFLSFGKENLNADKTW
jgi:hypothetical protein